MFNPEVLQSEQPEPEKSKEGLLRKLVGEKIQGVVNESRLPNEDYDSTVGVYGGKMKIEEDGKMVWDRKGFVSKLDTAGDAVLRTYDEHLVKEPWKLLKKHPRWFLKFLAPGSKRFRGSNQEVVDNAERLGLSEYYGLHENGVEIKQPEIYTHGIALQDVFRSDMIDSDKLKETERYQALAEAAKYVRQIHDKYGGIGEVLVSDIIFQENKDEKLGKPVLNLPDIVWSKRKNTSEKDKKTTDLADFLASVFGEEYRRTQNLEDASRVLDIVLENYGDKDIISLVESFVKRGRMVLQGDAEILNLPDTITKKTRAVFSQHNKARLGAQKDLDAQMKFRILEACEAFVNKK